MLNTFANFGSSSNLDILVIATFAAVFLLSTFFLSYGRIINNVISIYVTSALIEGVPFSRRLIEQISESRDPNYNVKMILLGILIMGIFVVVSWGVSQRTAHGQDHTSWLSDSWKVLILGFVQAGLLTSVVLGYLDSILASQISWSMRKIFIGETAKIIWFLLPIAVLIVVSKMSGREEYGSRASRGPTRH
ncbi:MAG: hypothetical protein Q8M83_00725 [bacterium]|nr:hypothetical protein [bacterium]